MDYSSNTMKETGKDLPSLYKETSLAISRKWTNEKPFEKLNSCKFFSKKSGIYISMNQHLSFKIKKNQKKSKKNGFLLRVNALLLVL